MEAAAKPQPPSPLGTNDRVATLYRGYGNRRLEVRIVGLPQDFLDQRSECVVRSLRLIRATALAGAAFQVCL